MPTGAKPRKRASSLLFPLPLLLVTLIGIGLPVPAAETGSLQQHLAGRLGDLLQAVDVRWTTRVADGKTWLDEVWFGVREDLLRQGVAAWPVQVQNKLKLKDFTLAGLESQAQTVIWHIGGKYNYKPFAWVEATGDFQAVARFTFDQTTKQARLVIDRRLEKLRAKKLNLNLRDLANWIGDRLHVQNKEKVIDAAPLVARMDAVQVRFNRFIVSDGFLWLSASSQVKREWSQLEEQALKLLKSGLVQDAARKVVEALAAGSRSSGL